MNVLASILLAAFYLYAIGLNLITYSDYLLDVLDKLNYNLEHQTYKEYIEKNSLLRLVNIVSKTMTFLIILIIIKAVTVYLWNLTLHQNNF